MSQIKRRTIESNLINNHKLNQVGNGESNQVWNRESNPFGNGRQCETVDAYDGARIGYLTALDAAAYFLQR